MAHRAGTRSALLELPPYLVLLRVGFALPARLLARRCALTAPFHPYRNLAAPAVCSLWHLPSNRLKPAVPDVIRHTALRSSDFPLPRLTGTPKSAPASLATAIVRSGCQPFHYSAEESAQASSPRWRGCALVAIKPYPSEQTGTHTPSAPLPPAVESSPSNTPVPHVPPRAEIS